MSKSPASSGPGECLFLWGSSPERGAAREGQSGDRVVRLVGREGVRRPPGWPSGRIWKRPHLGGKETLCSF